MSFYKSHKWERKRKAILRRDEYLCRQCRRFGRTTSANTVHHIHPREERPDLELDDRNLISLCAACHDGMHDRITGALTAVGEWWRRKVGELRQVV